MLAALRPTDNGRPLIAVVGVNDATETTDYLMPAGILRRADIADVMLLATEPGPVHLYPALKVQPDATIAQFDAAHARGADYVIVPAMSRDDDQAVLEWLNEQAAKGAFIIGICAGAKVVGAAGLLNGRRATTHWYYLDELLTRHPTIQYVKDRRMVVDERVATTTGISASMPMMLTLIEAIGGRAKAEEVAGELGLDDWNAQHASDSFRLTRDFATTVIGNRAAFWKHEDLDLRLEPGMDEVSLALVADAWSRTYRASVTSSASSASPVITANGVRILPDAKPTAPMRGRQLSTYVYNPPAAALDLSLEALRARYGDKTAGVVAMQLEYPTQRAR